MKKITATVCLFCLLFSLSVTGAAAPALGDADSDGRITSSDARLVLRVSVGLDKPGSNIGVMDVDADLRITSEDARLILRRAVLLDLRFPSESLFPAPQETSTVFVSVGAPRALLYEADSNRLLYQKNIDAKTAPASLLKLLTALTALKYCAVDQIMTVGDEIKLIASDSSVCGLQTGWRLSLYQLLCGMLLPSGNDAAYCVAANVARTRGSFPRSADAVSCFVSLMNDTARELGLTATCAMTPDGYDAPGQYTTARDLLTLTRAAMQNRILTDICSHYQVNIRISEDKTVTWKSTNRYLNPNDAFYDERVFGMKGGFTDDAGCCLIVACTLKGKNYIVIVMGADTYTKRYQDATLLMNAAAAS